MQLPVKPSPVGTHWQVTSAGFMPQRKQAALNPSSTWLTVPLTRHEPTQLPQQPWLLTGHPGHCQQSHLGWQGQECPGTGRWQDLILMPRSFSSASFQCSFPCTSPCLLVAGACHKHREVSVGHLARLLPEQVQAVGPSLVAGLGPPHTHSLQVLGPLAELCKQLLPSLSALRLMFQQQLSHPSLWEASSKQIAGGGGIYLGMTGLQSIYSTGNHSLLKCQIDSSSSTGWVRAHPGGYGPASLHLQGKRVTEIDCTIECAAW